MAEGNFDYDYIVGCLADEHEDYDCVSYKGFEFSNYKMRVRDDGLLSKEQLNDLNSIKPNDSWPIPQSVFEEFQKLYYLYRSIMSEANGKAEELNCRKYKDLKGFLEAKEKTAPPSDAMNSKKAYNGHKYFIMKGWWTDLGRETTIIGLLANEYNEDGRVNYEGYEFDLNEMDWLEPYVCGAELAPVDLETLNHPEHKQSPFSCGPRPISESMYDKFSAIYVKYEEVIKDANDKAVAIIEFESRKE